MVHPAPVFRWWWQSDFPEYFAAAYLSESKGGKQGNARQVIHPNFGLVAGYTKFLHTFENVPLALTVIDWIEMVVTINGLADHI